MTVKRISFAVPAVVFRSADPASSGHTCPKALPTGNSDGDTDANPQPKGTSTFHGCGRHKPVQFVETLQTSHIIVLRR